MTRDGALYTVLLLFFTTLSLTIGDAPFHPDTTTQEEVTEPLRSSENSEESIWQLPPLQWVKDLESGYISTAPIVRDEMTYVKVGGKSDNPGGPWDEGKGPGIYAFNTFSGDLVWRYEHNQSRSGFEISPPALSWDGGTLLNGWTSGNITAHDAQTGELLWMYETERVSWGVTGSIIPLQYDQKVGDRIFVSSERGVVSLSWEGELLTQHLFPDGAIGYRNQIGWGILVENATEISEVENGFVFAAGDEQGGLHTWTPDGGNFTSYDLSELLGENDWRVRTPPFTTYPRDDEGKYGMGVVVQGEGGGEFVMFQLAESDTLQVDGRVDLGVAPALPMPYLPNMVVTGDLDGVQAHCTYLAAMCDAAITVDDGPVSGELTAVGIPGGEMGVVVPHNSADGFWRGHHLWFDEWGMQSQMEWEWRPLRSGWLTAGIGTDGVGYAGGNDASWLEVRYPTQMRPDHLLLPPDLTGDDGAGAGGERDNETEDSTNSEGGSDRIETTATGLPLSSEIGLIAIFTLSIAGIVAGGVHGKRLGSLGVLAVLLLLLPTLNLAWVTTVNDQAASGTPSALREGFPDAWNGTQVVCFEYPEDLWWGVDGQTILLDWTGEEIGDTGADSAAASRLCVGGLTGHETIHGASLEAAMIANLTYTYESQPLGLFVEDIGPAKGGDGDRWWLYWVDGVHGNLAVDLQPVAADSVVEWRFL